MKNLLKINKLLATILLSLILSACATSGKINRISLGMTKAEVIGLMGAPVSTSATDGTEYMNYRLSETSDEAFEGRTTPYFVRIVNGRVDSYGRTGDFDSTQPDTIRIERR